MNSYFLNLLNPKKSKLVAGIFLAMLDKPAMWYRSFYEDVVTLSEHIESDLTKTCLDYLLDKDDNLIIVTTKHITEFSELRYFKDVTLKGVYFIYKFELPEKYWYSIELFKKGRFSEMHPDFIKYNTKSRVNPDMSVYIGILKRSKQLKAAFEDYLDVKIDNTTELAEMPSKWEYIESYDIQETKSKVTYNLFE